MPSFPVLKCGASLQHPAERTLRYETHVTRFLDGSEQRFRNRGTAAKQWTSSLVLLDESESRQIEALFEERQGQFGGFSFVDPWDGTVNPDCRFTDAGFERRQDDETRFSLRVTIESAQG